MSTNTEYLNLELPSENELFNLPDTMNDNNQKLDLAIKNHVTNTNNPHSITKAHVGLGNVDNTSDTDKPISTATATALDTKATVWSGTQAAYDALPTKDQSTLYLIVG